MKVFFKHLGTMYLERKKLSRKMTVVFKGLKIVSMDEGIFICSWLQRLGQRYRFKVHSLR